MSHRVSASKLLLTAALTFSACGRPASAPDSPRSIGWRHEETFDYGAGGFEIVQTDAREDGTRFVGVVGDSLYFLTLTRGLVSVPLEGGPPSNLADIPSMSDADANGIVFVTPDCKISSWPSHVLGACQGEPHWVRVRSGTVYVLTDDSLEVSAPGATTLWQVARTGGEVRKVASFDGANMPSPDFVADDDFLYYAIAGRLVRLPRHGGEAITLLEPAASKGSPKISFVDKEYLYWSTDEYVVRMPKRGGELVRMTDGPGRITTDGSHFYWMDGSLRFVYRAPVGGGDWSVLAKLPTHRDWNVVPRGPRVYAVDETGATVLRIDSNARPPSPVLQQPSAHPFVGLAIAASSLYYVSARYDEASRREVDELRSAPRSGGEPTVVSSDARFETAPVVDDRFAYYLAKDRALHRAPLAGGPPAVLVPPGAIASRVREAIMSRLCGRGGLELPRHVQLDGSHIYWIDPERGAIAKVSKQGGAPTAIVRDADGICGLALDESHIYFMQAFVNHGESIFGVVKKVPKSGGDPEVVASMGGQPGRMILSQSYVVWSQSMPNRVGYAKKNGGPATYLDDDEDAVQGRHDGGSFAAVGDVLYFTRSSDPHDGEIVRMSLPDGRTTVLATAQDRPISIRADDRSVFWINSGFKDGKMHKLFGCCGILSSRP